VFDDDEIDEELAELMAEDLEEDEVVGNFVCARVRARACVFVCFLEGE
jgi:hypothetical protein